VLFQAERGGSSVEDVWRQVREDGLDEGDHGYADPLDREGVAFADSLLEAYSQHRDEIEIELDGLIEGWSFNQMAQTDLNILRLAVAEMRYGPDVPPEVSIEMAVRLAKRFGGEESGRFVNGVLAKLFRALATTEEG
jgi:N utilization substance protein B